MAAGPLGAPPSDDAAIAARLSAAGFTPLPRRDTWFRSWTLPSRGDALRDAARSALGVEPTARLELERRPSYEGDPRVPIGILLSALYFCYAVVAGWVVLAAWDVALPSRAHPASAIWAQLVGPAIAFALFAAYVTVIPRWRLARAAAHRPPTPREVDLGMPHLTLVGLLLPPVILLTLLAITA